MQQAISLQDLNKLIKDTLDQNLDPAYWVVGEIGEFRDSVRGHAYLDLIEKQEGEIKAKTKANIWSYSYQGIRRRFESITGNTLCGGMKILALVNVQFHEVYGLSLTIKDIDPNFTIGERAKRRQEVIDRLTSEGLINLNKQFELPTVPQKIAVISSVTAAGYGDFISQLTYNADRYNVSHELFQASMQGAETPKSIIAALDAIETELIRKPFDLIVIIRGGGAQADMDSFDDYDLAKAIAEAALPVITGIGHERDESVADLVAHTKLKTPTAVASFILSGFKDFEEKLNHQLTRMERTSRYYLQQEDRVLRDREHLLKQLINNKLNIQSEYLNRKLQELRSLAKYRLDVQQLNVASRKKDVQKLAKVSLEKGNTNLGHLENQLLQLDPHRILGRGYTRTELDGKPIQSQFPKSGDEIVTITSRQRITSTIKEIN